MSQCLFSLNLPSGRFSLLVAMSVCLSVCAIAKRPLPGVLETSGWRAYQLYLPTITQFLFIIWNIGSTIRICQEIQGLLYVEFLKTFWHCFRQGTFLSRYHLFCCQQTTSFWYLVGRTVGRFYRLQEWLSPLRCPMIRQIRVWTLCVRLTRWRPVFWELGLFKENESLSS